MRVLLQRCQRAAVHIEGTEKGRVGRGFVLLVGVTHEDNEAACDWLAEKIVNLRVFEDREGKMNLSLSDVQGEILSISQFTLYGDCTKGRRPNFMNAAKPAQAEALYDYFNEALRRKGVHVETGVFGAMMEVDLVNEGPVTLMLEK